MKKISKFSMQATEAAKKVLKGQGRSKAVKVKNGSALTQTASKMSQKEIWGKTRDGEIEALQRHIHALEVRFESQAAINKLVWDELKFLKSLRE